MPLTSPIPAAAQLQLAVKLYVFCWDRPGLPGRKGTFCRVLARGKMNSCLIEFVDGTKAIVSRNAIRVYRGEPCR